jgi:hypothetical protein
MKRIPLIIALLSLPIGMIFADGCLADSALPEISGWKLTVEEKIYTPENLWDVIDGAADLFLEYSFVDLHIGRYQQSPDLEVKAEVYRHKSAVDAFGMYSQERYPDYHFIELGVQGYLEKGSLNFLSGPYYVKISTIQSGQIAQDGMLRVAKEICRHLNQDNGKPQPLGVFPTEGKQANTEQYVARNFLGYSFFNSAFVANYGEGGELKAFVMQMETAEKAQGTITEYLKSLTKSGSVKDEGGIFDIQDPHNGRVEVAVRKNFVFGVVGSGGEKNHRSFLKQLENRLPFLQ